MGDQTGGSLPWPEEMMELVIVAVQVDKQGTEPSNVQESGVVYHGASGRGCLQGKRPVWEELISREE